MPPFGDVEVGLFLMGESGGGGELEILLVGCVAMFIGVAVVLLLVGVAVVCGMGLVVVGVGLLVIKIRGS